MNTPDPNSPLSSLPRRDQDLRSRRRRRGQLNIPHDAEGRAALIASLAHRAYPTYELFIFAALSGSILALGYLMDSRALLLFGVLVAPLLRSLRAHDCYFSAAHAAKDSGIAVALGKAAGLRLPQAEATLQQYQLLVASGKGELDKSAIADLTFKDRRAG